MKNHKRSLIIKYTHSARRPTTFHVFPFLKWAGGKRWLVQRYPELLSVRYSRFVEPFVGSAAVFYFMQPPVAILSDINQELIATYWAVREDWARVFLLLEQHRRHHSKEYYYRMREQEPTGSAARAARLIYLNRTCWNSLYRVNRQGKFNVPIGSKNEVFLPTDNFEATSLALRSAKLVCSDFEPVLDETSSGDLVFADPPYTVSHGNNGFIKYNENLFSWEDQVRLAKSATAAVTRGAMVLVTNVFQAQVRELYQKSFVFMKLSRYSRMAADVLARKACDELVAISRNMHEELRDAGILS